MKRKRWSSQEKFRIVMEGLSAKVEISKLCVKYGVSQTQYYKWRDQFLKLGHQTFETKAMSQKEEKLQSENKKLKGIIGDLTVELKKNEEEFF